MRPIFGPDSVLGTVKGFEQKPFLFWYRGNNYLRQALLNSSKKTLAFSECVELKFVAL